MKLEPDPIRLVRAQSMQAEMQDALAKQDAKRLLRLFAEIPRLTFEVGATYRLLVYGAPPELPREKPETIVEALGKLVGLDFDLTIAAAALAEIVGTYAGCAGPEVYAPHIFRLSSGMTAVLGDVDLIAWRKA